MSNWREQLSGESETKAVTNWLTDFYHYPILAVLIGFVFWNRIRNWSSFVVGDEVYYSGNDPWYHHRTSEYATENLLGSMPFDPWTYFPFGSSVGQFGTLFDQIIAFFALIIGLGSPSSGTFDHVFLLAPPFFAVAICVPAYLIGRRLGGRFGGLVTIGFIAFAPDRLLQMTLAGHVQHHSAEVLFMSLSVLGIMVALSAAEQEKPVYELITAGEIRTLRSTIGWSLLAGVAMSMYLWAWPPGVWLFGILGVFFVVHLSWEHIRGRSPEHTAFVGVISLATAGILQLSSIRTFEFSVTSRSILQPGLAFAVVFGILFMARLSREVERRDVSKYTYPGVIAGAIIVVVGLAALLLPDLFSFFFSQVDRVFGFVTSPGEAAGTIGEAQPPSDRGDYLYSRYGLAAVTAALGAAVILGRQLLYEEPDSQELLLVFWGAFMLAATFTQVRFGYYLTVPIGALNAVLAGFLMKTIGAPDSRELTIETYQVLTIALVILVMFVPLLGLPFLGVDNTAADRADDLSQPGNVLAWDDSLSWMEENTPEPGKYGNPDGESMEYLGTYERTENYEYPEGAYGVLSWWDYGHWITNRAERIPNANPFQEGANQAAHFLLAQSEDEALDELEENFDDSENAKTEYVMIDWLMAETEGQVGGKYFAPAQFHDDFTRSDLYQRIIDPNAEITSPDQLFQATKMTAHSQPYYDSMLTRLYHYHGSAKAPEPIGTERRAGEQRPVQGFESLEAAQEWAAETESRQVGGIGLLPEERVEALEHFRVVHMSETSAIPNPSNEDAVALSESGVNFNRQAVVNRAQTRSGIVQAYLESRGIDPQEATQQNLSQIQGDVQNALAGSNPAWVKTFERVPGATIDGEGGPENGILEVSVRIEPKNGQPFNYQQRVETDENGEFTTTVPYSTTGYDEVGVEDGYTNVSARANSSYTITSGFSQQNETLVSYTANDVAVTEQQVVSEDSDPITVELERQEFDLGGGQEDESGANDGTDGSEDDQTTNAVKRQTATGE